MVPSQKLVLAPGAIFRGNTVLKIIVYNIPYRNTRSHTLALVPYRYLQNKREFCEV